MPATRPSGGILDLGDIQRRPEFGRLALQHRNLRHHRDVSRRLAGLGRLFKLDKPGFAGRFGNGFDRDARRLGEFREDVLVERILEITTIDADFQRLVLRAQDRWHGEHGHTGKTGAEHGTAADRLFQKFSHHRSPVFAGSAFFSFRSVPNF
jgi:hypothetical protein